MPTNPSYQPFANGWNFADMFESNADRFPDSEALVEGHRRLSWAQLDKRADSIAAWLVGAGLGHQAKVAQYLYNCPEFMESMFALFKASLVPVNTNYRYADDELVYLWDNADAEAVIFHSKFEHNIERIRPRLTKVKAWLWVAESAGDTCPDWATKGPPVI